MKRRRVLVVCMFDSIHAGRWLSQFTDQDIDFLLFPSKKFKNIHPKLRDLISDQSLASFSITHPLRVLGILGYLDFALFVQLSRLLKSNLRAKYLKRLLNKQKFDYVHALEIQGAGYLCAEAITNKNFKLILTNWGSDIFYFQHLPEHLSRIKSVLAKADLYSAECIRDYKLAIELGFSGVSLPCIPNGGGFSGISESYLQIPASMRNNIVVKTYGGIFGRGNLAIDAVAKVLEGNHHLTAFFYSVTEDLELQVSNLKKTFGERVKFSTLKDPLSQSELFQVFMSSKIYIGCSISDGLSTSFLEALNCGVYPIQTNTSCAGELIEKGVVASLVNLEPSELNSALEYCITNNKALDHITRNNLRVSAQEHNFAKVKNEALKFYAGWHN